eukprot:c20554_g1_i4 orf=95-286(-)
MKRQVISSDNMTINAIVSLKQKFMLIFAYSPRQPNGTGKKSKEAMPIKFQRGHDYVSYRNVYS